jgi:hypothetical protein
LQHVMQSYCLFESKKENILPYCSVDGSGRHRPSFESFLSLLQQLGLLPISREPGFYPCIPQLVPEYYV